MRTLHVALLLAVVTLASTAEAHSWSPASVVGTINPGTLRCDDHGCTATILADRIEGLEGLDGDINRRGDEIDVTFPPSVVLSDRERTRPWPDAKSALLAAGNGRVRLRGDRDFMNGRVVLVARRGARMSSTEPASTAPGELFSGCGHPPWTQVALARCYAAGVRSRMITVRGTLATEALAETSKPHPVTALDLDNISVGDDGFAIAPPIPYEIAVLRPDAKLGRVAADRSALSTLRVGDRLVLEAMYQLPAPASEKRGVEPRCTGDRCWPRLLVAQIDREAKR